MRLKNKKLDLEDGQERLSNAASKVIYSALEGLWDLLAKAKEDGVDFITFNGRNITEFQVEAISDAAEGIQSAEKDKAVLGAIRDLVGREGFIKLLPKTDIQLGSKGGAASVFDNFNFIEDLDSVDFRESMSLSSISGSLNRIIDSLDDYSNRVGPDALLDNAINQIELGYSALLEALTSGVGKEEGLNDERTVVFK